MRNNIFVFFLLLLLSVNVFAATKTWDGGGADANWTTAANWSTDIAPVAGDDLIFPAAAAQHTNNNNFFFLTSFRSITVEGGTYTFGGNPIRLTNGMIIDSGTQTINFAITLSGAQTFFAGTGATATIVILSVGSSPLTIDGAGIVGIGLISGSGSVTKNGSGAGAIITATGFSGGILLNDGIFIVDASIPNSTVAIQGAIPTGTPALSGFGGTGTVGATTVKSGVISAGTLSSPTGVLNINNAINFTPNGAYACKIGGTSPGANGHDQLNVVGTVILDNAVLAPIPWNGFVPAKGDTFIIISNDGTDAINGTFLNLPEGSIFGALDTQFQITYLGGDGNDVSIERIAEPSVSGTITYGNAIGNPAPPRFVSNVLLSGTGTTNISATSAFPGGNYSITGFGTGSYTVTPSKTGGINAAITSFDAAKIALHVAGTTVLTGNPLIVADVSGNGSISSFDAGQVARYAAGVPGSGSAATWIFSPANRNYAAVTSNVKGEDFVALLMGDVSGNWVDVAPAGRSTPK
ncbi:MAG: hypothetical protein IPL32_02485 [Chloracidobacterium sp.]|nr:hypothetical protein [Chloracidobacterium sp.]